MSRWNHIKYHWHLLPGVVHTCSSRHLGTDGLRHPEAMPAHWLLLSGCKDGLGEGGALVLKGGEGIMDDPELLTWSIL